MNIINLFQLSVQRYPNNIAVTDNNNKLTYQKLDEITNDIAINLLSHGAKEGDFVGLYLDRSIDSILAILGILKAGAAYIPIDMAIPQERIKFVLEDSQVKLIIVQQKNQEKLSIIENIHSCNIEHLKEKNNELHMLPQISDDMLAYIIYTSGTTGKPKGVLVSHRNVTRLFEQTEQWFSFSPTDKVLLFHSYAFDFSVWEIWSALFYGGQLIIPDFYLIRSYVKFREFIKDNNITVLNQTPTAFYELIRVDKKYSDSLSSLRCIIFGGEKLIYANLIEWVKKYGVNNPELINMYGITETTIHVTYHKLSEEEITKNCESIIGVPIPDMQLYVLDENYKQVEKNQQGELFIAGGGVTKGYLNRKELTEERFINNPFGKGKLYKSGDVVQYNLNGELEYIKRNDTQVKIRGYRIELGEIEKALIQCGAINPILRVNDKQLVAYIVKEQENLSALEDKIRKILPDYMLPRIIYVNSIPLTINGKVDFDLLEKLSKKIIIKGEFPKTGEEKILADIFSRVLNVSDIGTENNFFELGGDSIKVLSILSGCQENGKTFDISSFYAHPTIAHLISILQDLYKPIHKKTYFSLIDKKVAQKHFPHAIDVYPLTRLQEGMVFEYFRRPHAGVYFDVYSYCVGGRFDEKIFRETLNRLVERHEILRTSFSINNEFKRPMQVIYEAAEIGLYLVDITNKNATEQDDFIKKDMDVFRKQMLDLNKPGLLFFTVYLLDDHSFQLTIAFHHLILDGWSLSVLITELLERYHSLLYNIYYKEHQIDCQYIDYVKQELNSLQDNSLTSFWTKKVKEIAYHSLCTDNIFLPLLDPKETEFYEVGSKNMPHIKTISSKDNLELDFRVEPIIVYDVPISVENSKNIQNFAKEWNVPLYIPLLVVHLRVIALITRKNKVTIGIPTHNRPECKNAEYLLGLFLNMLPLTFTFDYGENWRNSCLKAMSAYQELLPNRSFPMHEIMRLSETPLFDSVFNFVDFYLFNKLSIEINWLKSQYFEANEISLLPYFQLNNENNLVLRLYGNTEKINKSQIQIIGNLFYESLLQLAKEAYNPIFLKNQDIVFTNIEIKSSDSAQRNYIEKNIVNFVSPRNKVEENLYDIWKYLLGKDNFSVYDNFFNLGGDSLGVMQMVALAAEAGIDLDIVMVMEHQTIADLFKFIKNKEPAK